MLEEFDVLLFNFVQFLLTLVDFSHLVDKDFRYLTMFRTFTCFFKIFVHFTPKEAFSSRFFFLPLRFSRYWYVKFCWHSFILKGSKVFWYQVNKTPLLHGNVLFWSMHSYYIWPISNYLEGPQFHLYDIWRDFFSSYGIIVLPSII